MTLLWLLLLVPLAGGLFAQRRLQEVFVICRGIPNRVRLTGADVAARLLGAHGLHAYQDADGSRAYRLGRAAGEPLSRFAPFSALCQVGFFAALIPVARAMDAAV